MDKPFKESSLKKALFEPPSHTDSYKQALSPSCALKDRKPCCHGKGYVMSAEGILVKAELCSCIINCPSCYGRMRKLDQGISKICATLPPTKIVHILNEAQIPARYLASELYNFNNFSGNGKTIQNDFTLWLEGFSLQHSPGILLTGGVGIGKTYLLASLAKGLSRQGISVRFVDFFHLLSEIKYGYSQSESDLTHLQPLIDVDVLLIDELGKGRNTDFEMTIIDQLIMARYNAKKIVIASSNYGAYSNDGNDLRSRVGDRSFSRLLEMCKIFELTGRDMRVLLAQSKNK